MTGHSPTPITFEEKREQLLASLRSLPAVVVAYSGGVDSAVVAWAARESLGDRAIAVTGVSASLAAGELDGARETAERIGIRHVVLATDEFERPEYLANGPDRCFHCKTELYTRVSRWLAETSPLGAVEVVVVNGANVDDLGDYRPGLRAAADHRVVSPLADAGMTKADVRRLAEECGLPIWDKPASPCLSSRIAYGESVTPERLTRIDEAERFLRGLGLAEVRVRLHPGELARIEAPPESLPRLAEALCRAAVVAKLKELGFTFVTLDLEGLRSGSLNQLLRIGARTE